MSQEELNNKAENNGCILIDSESKRMHYAIRRIEEERISLGIVIRKDKGVQAIEIPLKELEVISQELNDILELYF